MEDRIQQSKLINKAIIIVSILLVLAFLIYIGKDAMLTYKHPGYKFSIDYPSAWAKFENYEGTAVAFLSPKDSEVDSFQENVNVIVQNQTENVLSLEKYTEMAVFQVRVVFKTGIEVSEAESGGTYLGGRPAYKFVYFVRGEPEYKMMHVWTVVGARAYQVNYTAESSHFDDYKEVFEKMVKSFRLP